jgi:hypothetical protein
VVDEAALIVACLLVATTAATADDKQRYTLGDLEVLVANRSYQEAITHLGDVAPAQRTAKWEEVGALAASGFVASLPDDTKLPAIDAIDRQYPQLAKSPKFARARAEHGVVGLESCYRGRYRVGDCTTLGVRLADGADRTLVVDVARVVAKHDPVQAVSLFKRVLTKDTCRDEQLKRATVTALSQVAPATDARAIVQTCWSELREPVMQAFDQAGKSGNVYKNTCDLLEAKGVLSSLQLKRCRAK